MNCLGRHLSTAEAPLPITTLTEEEELLKKSVADFAREKVLPFVRQMDHDAKMPRSLITSMHEQGKRLYCRMGYSVHLGLPPP